MEDPVFIAVLTKLTGDFYQNNHAFMNNSIMSRLTKKDDSRPDDSRLFKASGRRTVLSSDGLRWKFINWKFPMVREGWDWKTIVQRESLRGMEILVLQKRSREYLQLVSEMCRSVYIRGIRLIWHYSKRQWMVITWREVWFSIKKSFWMGRVVPRWNKLLHELISLSSLEVFKILEWWPSWECRNEACIAQKVKPVS